ERGDQRREALTLATRLVVVVLVEAPMAVLHRKALVVHTRSPTDLDSGLPTGDDARDRLAGVDRLPGAQLRRGLDSLGVEHKTSGVGAPEEPVLDERPRPSGALG